MKTQSLEEETVKRAYAEYEKVHTQYMNTNTFTLEFELIRKELAIKNQAYIQAVKDLHPDWIVF